MNIPLIQPGQGRLDRPRSCEGCPLDSIADGFMRPSLAVGDRYRVALVGEALGANEAEAGAPFVGAAGFKLTRLIEWAGLDRSKFDIFNSVWCRPPNNKLEGEPYETASIEHCKTAHWGRLLDRSNVLVPMGNVALAALTGRKGILKARGYIHQRDGLVVVPTVHPSFIQRGMSKYSAAFIHDIQKAVEVARSGVRYEATSYVIDPRPGVAYQWGCDLRDALLRSGDAGCPRYLAFDIETPGKGEDEGDLDADDPTYHIFRIGFSYKGLSGLSIPWTPEFIPTIRLLLELPIDKVVWNAGFDVPRVLAAGVDIRGTIHDGMVAWHILHSDLPKGLGFVATFTCPWQQAWKHTSHANPGLYNAIDADVELRSMDVIESELKRTGLWDVYQSDVLDLEPILAHMHRAGMPVDSGVRYEKSVELAKRQLGTIEEMTTNVPLEARKIAHVYVNTPKDLTGLLSRPGRRTVQSCPNCGVLKPNKPHFKVYKKKPNPCAGLSPVPQEIEVVEWYALAEFKPSRDQLIRYNNHLDRRTPTKWDKRAGKRVVTTDEKAIKTLIAKYPDDKVYKGVLEYRELDKIAGTYIGRPNC